MRTVSQMSFEISRAAQTLFADSAEPLLKPMIEGDRRFLSSDICIRMARRRGQDPAGLARELLTSLHPASGEQWVQHAGYLNITFSDLTLEDAEDAFDAGDLPEVTIFVAARSPAVSEAAMLRLSAPAILQAWLLKNNRVAVRIMLGELVVHPDSFASLGELWAAVVAFARTERTTGVVLHDQVLDIWRNWGKGLCCFFLFPGDVEHTLWRDGGREAGFDERVSFFIPDRGWLAEIDPPPIDSRYLDDHPEGCLSLLLHLCSSSRGVDIEWQTPRFSERKNLLWCLSSTRKRLADLTPQVVCAAGGSIELHSDIMFLIRFLPDYYRWALRAGEVVPWVLATASLLERVSALLNDPSLRIERRPGELPLARLCPALVSATSKIYSFFHVD